MDEDSTVWPPPPTGPAPEKPGAWRKYVNLLLFLLVCGGGMVAGAIIVPLLLLLAILLTDRPGGPIGFLLAILLAAFVGAVLGLAGGLILWFAARPILRRLTRRFLPHLLPLISGK